LAKDIGVPEYINAAPRMDFTQLSEFSALDMTGTYDILEKWPAQPMGKLDVSQWVALKRMLTKRLAIIQGPPGTGKTFTSIAALKMMLANKGPNDPPIIIASQTNHALDQLIKHISVFEKNFVRLGGRTTDPEIRKRTPYEIRQNQGLLTIGGGLMASMKTKQNNLTAEIEKLLEPFSRSNSDQTIPASLFLKYGILSKEQFQCLEEVARNWQQPNISANADPLRAWLTGCVTAFDSKYIGDFGFVNDDIDLEYEQLKEIEVEHGGYEDEWSTFRTRFVQLSPGLCGSGTGEISRATIELWLKEKHLYNIHPNCRGSVYGYMRRELIKILGEHLHALAQAYKDCSANFQIGRFERDHCILQKANIIGMTTTGLSKYRGLVSSLNPRVILIEEAAQVLEAPVAVACLPSLQHLILVGDHLQLKGQCADHGLCGRPFYLDVSMFERLMLNKMPYSMLREQRRMVPEIRKLVAPVYGNLLHDHPSVNDHPFIPGMGDKRSFFFDHTSHESSDSLSSKVNDFEASMVVNFLAYLVMNKVPATSITVLTFYNGQKKLIMRKKAQNHNVAQTYVNILTVDSYQGEENDIVILSLVRSNHNRGIGFLQQDNRICVALSRAKYGLYIFGNARCIRKYSDLWRSVTNVMTADLQDPRLGSALPLYCERHNEETIIRSESPTCSTILTKSEKENSLTVTSRSQ
jgi:helicase required for RNAi-mediated heterochromatin assembly 1